MSNGHSEARVVRRKTTVVVVFPFAFKDTFRALFPRARWFPDEKHWELPLSAAERVEEFIAEIAATAEDMRAAEAAEDAEPLSPADRALLATSIDVLRAEAQQLRALKQARLAQAALDATAITEQRTMLGAIVDLPALQAAERTMAATMNPASRVHKERFEEARAVFKAARSALEAAGIRCHAVGWLASANVNRPDRDHPRFMPANAWHVVTRVAEADAELPGPVA